MHVLSSARVGGASLVAMTVAQRLQELGWNVRAFIPGDGPAQEALRQRGIQASIYNQPQLCAANRLEALVGNLMMGVKLRSWQKSLVHFHSPRLFGSARRCLGRCVDVVH